MKIVLIFIILIHSGLVAQTPCNDFNSGYKNINWDMTPIKARSSLTDSGFRLFEKNEYKTNDGRTAIRYHFKLNDYDHYKTDESFFEYVIKFMDGEMFSIKYLSHFNWNYNYKMAKNSANKIAEKYQLPKKNEQKFGFGMTNLVWYQDCPNLRVLVRLLWNPNVVYDNYATGEVTRYVEIWVFDVNKEKEYGKIVRISQNEKRQSRENDILNDF